ncbi:MAG: glycerol-3-phosphate acyltransferase [Oscillospiraceae bacterium]|nr:glycerol-3-phosphate acyltransferase [Oscillospiraceae bacterium]
MTILRYLIAALIGYLLGCSNMAYYIARSKGLDIHQIGTGNPGASNAMMSLGWKVGILVGLHDIGKAFVAVLLCKTLFPALPYAPVAAGTACVLGHLFPFYLRFRGGKGFASTYGMILGLDWRVALILGVLIILVVLLTDYIVAGTVTAVVGYPIYCLCTRQLVAAALTGAVAVVILLKHRENFTRILNGTEVGLRKAHRGEMRVDRETADPDAGVPSQDGAPSDSDPAREENGKTER